MVNLQISKNDLIAQLVADNEKDNGILDFIADLADYYSFHKHGFRDQVMERMEADK